MTLNSSCKTWFWDLETLDIFTATFVAYDSDEIVQFVISKTKDQRKELFDFYNKHCKNLIGYNSVFFDAQIMEYLYRYPTCTAKDIKRYAAILTSDNNRRPDVPEWKLRNNHIDLFKTLSLSTAAKRTGLKWCEFAIDFENIEDLPSDGDGNNWEEQVLSYNLNDVLATKELFFKYKHEFDLRNALSAKEKVNLINSTEPDMAKKLFAKYLSSKMKISHHDLRSMQTEREYVYVKEIIFPYVEFKTQEFNSILDKFKKLVLREYDKADFTLNWQGVNIDFGLGGIHASFKNKIIRSDDRFIIKSFDAASYYPHLMFQNELCPEHLSKEIFLPLYKGFYEQRKVIPKSDPSNYVFKILLNSTYGLTNDKFSFLRDRLVTLAICINGQLLLSMLVERLTTEIPECNLIMMNTDGAEILIPREYEEKYHEICKWWEELTRIPLEHEEYEKMIIADVNNYISVFINSKTKCKGKFEFENIPLHKNKSHSIIPKAVYNYFVNGIAVEDTIYNEDDIFMFCAGVKSKRTDIKGASWYELVWYENGEIKTQKLSKTVRYFISKQGKYLYKRYEDGSVAHVEAPTHLSKHKKDWKITYFNKSYKLDNIKDYNIDYTYYISKAREMIYQIENINQLTLF
jgi:hypothetical protein